jgi:hypothetical protein
MDLGAQGSGIQSVGNLNNPNLPPVGASLIVAAGTGRDASGFAARPDYLGVIDNFIRYDAFAAAGSASSSLNAQVLTQLSKDPTLAPLVDILKAGLAARSQASGAATALNAQLAQLSPEALAVGAVKLATAVQVVSNRRFVESQNSDTFAPAYAVFADLFPNLNNDTAVIRQFVQRNPFVKAPDGASLQSQSIQGLPQPLADAIRLGLASPSTVDQSDSAFSKALASIDAATLASGTRQLLANVLEVSGQSLDALSAAGKLTGSGTPYAKELTALAAAFTPTSASGLNDLNMGSNTIKVNQTGSVAVFAPRGSVIVGQAAPPAVTNNTKTAADFGVFTLGGGDIVGMVRNNFDVFRSRVFTVAGGDIDLWSSLGNIDAGRGPRDVAVASPPRLVTDPATGLEFLDFGASVTGSGIGALKTQENQAPSDINLMAPAGYVDAGEAGIRAETGTVTLGTNLVLNAGNIQAASGVSGGAVVATVAPPVPSSTNTSTADRVVEEAQREAIAQQQAQEQRAASQRRMRVIGEFISFDDDCSSESGQKDQSKCADGKSKSQEHDGKSQEH